MKVRRSLASFLAMFSVSDECLADGTVSTLFWTNVPKYVEFAGVSL
jgi:hypothetical protein